MLYVIHYHGGPQDGRVEIALKPYWRINQVDRHGRVRSVYAIQGYDPHDEPTTQDHVQWLDDDTRLIDQYWRPDLLPAPQTRR